MPIPPFPNKRKEEKLSKIALFLTSTSSEGKFNPSAENAQNWRADNPGSNLFKETTPHQVPWSCQGQINSFDHFLNLDEVGKVTLCRNKTFTTPMNWTKLDRMGESRPIVFRFIQHKAQFYRAPHHLKLQTWRPHRGCGSAPFPDSFQKAFLL